MSETVWFKDPQWWAIIIALLLGILGLFQDRIRRLFKKPKLKLSIKKEPPDCHKTTRRNIQTGESKGDCYYMRLKIDNSGNDQMENVEVMVVEVEKKDSNRGFEKITNFLPMNLEWSYYKRPTMSLILPKFFKHCDLGYIIKSDNANLQTYGRRKKSEIVLVIDILKKPFMAHIS